MGARDLTFLVVEDHAFQRGLLVRMLEGLGARTVHSAADGREAMRVLSTLEPQPDVILTDLNMPGMDGIEFIRHLGAARSGASMIVVSALERNLLSSVATMAKAYGVDLAGVVEKPVAPRKLEALIRRCASKAAVSGDTLAARPAIGLDEILDGLRDQRFEPYFLAKVEMATSRVLGAEALARWNHPQHGVLGPEVFIKALEQSGNIHLLFHDIFAKAARLCRRMRAVGLPQLVCVNLSLRQLAQPDLADEMTAAVRKAGIEPRDIVLEVTESAATDNIGRALETLVRLRMKGYGLGIDDYGTGYASLEQLARIPFFELKIDSSLVVPAPVDESARVILESSIEMARKLDILVVAEGVETHAQWQLLSELKCDAAQGYFIGRPLPADDFLSWLHTWKRMRDA